MESEHGALSNVSVMGSSKKKKQESNINSTHKNKQPTDVTRVANDSSRSTSIFGCYFFRNETMDIIIAIRGHFTPSRSTSALYLNCTVSLRSWAISTAV